MHIEPHNRNSRPRLLEHIEGIERLQDEKADIVELIKEAKARCKAEGFDIRIVNQMIRERRMTPGEREDWIALCEVYRANLGMLSGTPLGEHARKRFERQFERPAKQEPRPEDPGHDDEAAGAPEQEDDAPTAPSILAREQRPEKTLDEVREEGRQAAREGKKVFANPYLFADPRRSWWDEGFCQELGHDGMELPAALRRAEKPKKPKGNGKHQDDGEGK